MLTFISCANETLKRVLQFEVRVNRCTSHSVNAIKTIDKLAGGALLFIPLDALGK